MIKLFKDFKPDKVIEQFNSDEKEFFATQIFHTKDGWHIFAHYKEELKGGK